MNSPRDYAPCNGEIEESQRELKECLQEKLELAISNPMNHIAAYAESAVNDLNHRIRGCLNDRTSCQYFLKLASNQHLPDAKGERFMIV